MFLWIPCFIQHQTPPNPINLLVLLLYIILCPHSLHLLGSLDCILFSVIYFLQMCIIGGCFGGWISFLVSTVNPQVARRNFPPCTSKQILAYWFVTKILRVYHYCKIIFLPHFSYKNNFRHSHCDFSYIQCNSIQWRIQK